MNEMINVALPKGRLGDKAYAILERSGYPCPAMKEDNRKLTFENPEIGVRYFLVKPSDVAIYVEYGAADGLTRKYFTPLSAFSKTSLRLSSISSLTV